MSPTKTTPPQKKGDKKPVRPGNGKNPSRFFGPGGSFTGNLLSTILIFLLLMSAYSFLASTANSKQEISLSQVANDIKSGQVKDIKVEGNDLTLTYQDNSQKKSMKDPSDALPQTLVPYGITGDELSKVAITISNQSGFAYWFLTLAPLILPVILLGVLVWFLMRQVRGAGMQAFTFGQSKARMIDPEDTNQRVTFADVAGAKEAKQELMEVVDFLKNPKKFLDIGARIPKGILMMGAPGTGKTLLARAVAGEAGVPFYSISGSEFVEMFVGVGASRVRDLFQMAKKSAPAIIFVDEIDAVGRMRGTGVGGGNDEREQTLNQILVEMDGFDPTEKVIVMAATNRPDVLDSALLRPGRFDRRVTIDLPDRKDRLEIMAVHARKKPFGPDVNFDVVAERTPGFSGAELYSLMNEAAILAARETRKEITQYDLLRSIEKVMLGPERKSHLLSKKEKRITSYHEAGHALVSSVLPNSDPVHKVSVISRGRAGGYTLKLPFEDKKMPSKKEFIDDLATMLGGYAAEVLIFDDVTTGPSNDLSVATSLARSMVTRYGMSDVIGPAAFASDTASDGISQDLAAKMDKEVRDLVENAKNTATEVITKHRGALDSIANALIDVETLEREDFEKLLIVNGIQPKKREEEGIVIAEDLKENRADTESAQ